MSRSRLREGAVRLGLRPTEAQCDRLLAYGELLLKWNKVYNLTALRDAESVLTHHLLDCMAVVGPLSRERPDAVDVLDVGAGAGLPGAVIAILRPDVSVRCVDAVAKKVAFVQQASATLGLPNLAAQHARVEDLTARFDVVTARAFSTLGKLIAVTEHLLEADGVWVAMKGRLQHDERADVSDRAEVFHVEPLVVPGLDAERCLVWARKASR